MSNLTPERKDQLKKFILEEINNAGQSIKKTFALSSGKNSFKLTPAVSVVKKTDPVIKKPDLKLDNTIAQKTVTIPRVVSLVVKNQNQIIKKPEIKLSSVAVKKTVATPRVVPLTFKSQKIFSWKLSLPSFFKKNFYQKLKLNIKEVFNYRHGLLIWIFICFFAIIIFLVGNIFGIYKWGWRGPISRVSAVVLQLPMASVDGQVIKLSDYWYNLSLLGQSIENRREGVSDRFMENKDTGESVFYRLVANNLIKKDLALSGIFVSAEQVENYFKNIASGFSNLNDLTLAIKKTYNLNPKQFKEEVILPMILRQKLREMIITQENNSVNKLTKKRAGDVLQMAIAPGSDFKFLASQYTEDESGINTMGDLGWITRGKIEKELEQILFNLNAGDVYGELVKNIDGYHIFKVDAKLKSSETGEESIKLSQILIKIDIDSYIKNLLDRAVIKRYVP